jgi:hypothetical protein
LSKRRKEGKGVVLEKLTRKKKHPYGIKKCGILDHPPLKRKNLACLDDRRMSLRTKQASERWPIGSEARTCGMVFKNSEEETSRWN